jgi:cytochrome P450
VSLTSTPASFRLVPSTNNLARNARLGSQKGWNPLADALLSQVRWHQSTEEMNPLRRWHPLRPLVEWYNGRQMDRYIGKELDDRWAAYKADGGDKTKYGNSVIDLALQDYMMEEGTKNPSDRLDPEFRSVATSQIRMFLFAGHDTTSSTLCYCFHLLSANPDSLTRIRSEHNSIFGPDLSRLPHLLSTQPHLLNQLPYTMAVLKETERLFPGASAIRSGVPGVDLVDEDGSRYPTEGKNIWILHQPLQRNPKYWIRPLEFLPNRWLVGPEDPLYPAVKGAWRPFEFGPRNCIGQGLVQLELKIVLALVIREFDVQGAYAEWDERWGTSDRRTVDGERAYQIEKGGAHPADMFPCRVSFRTEPSP